VRELLERWAGLEPGFCKVETHHSQVSIFYARASEQSFYALVYSDAYPDRYHPNKNESLMRIQWAAQQAIVARGWRWNLECCPLTGICEGTILISLSYVLRRGDDPATALLTAYLAALENSTSLKEWESK
jgi:hypothetical protein